MSETSTGSFNLHQLLELQERDTVLDQLQYRREHLPAHEALSEVQKKAALLRPKLTSATAARDEVAAKQSALESEADAAEHRMAEINSRLYGSATISPKDAQAMSEEVKHLQDRKNQIEDRELEFMEALEPLQAEVEELEGQARSLAAEAGAAQAEIAEAQKEIDAEADGVREARSSLSQSVPQSLLAEYERLRKSLGGTGVAPLRGNSCGGCHLTLSATELDRIHKAAPDQVIHCEECGRILVR